MCKLNWKQSCAYWKQIFKRINPGKPQSKCILVLLILCYVPSVFKLDLNPACLYNFYGHQFSEHISCVSDGNLVINRNESRFDLLVFDYYQFVSMKTLSNGNIFHVTGHVCGEFTGHRWITRTEASDAALWCFLSSVPETGDLRRHRAHFDVAVMHARLIWHL